MIAMAAAVRSSIQICCQQNILRKIYHASRGKFALQHRLGFHTTSARQVVEVNMPSLSPTMSEGTIVKWAKNEGDSVSPGDVLCEIQTDKAVISLETEEEGILAKIIKGDDSKEIQVGTLIALIAEPGEDWQTIRQQGAPVITTGTQEVKNEQTKSPPEQTSEFSGVRHVTSGATILGPAVRTLLEQYGLKSSDVPATGPHGLLLKGDVLDFIKKNNLKPAPLKPVAPPQVKTSPKPAEATAAPKTKPKPVPSNEDLEFEDLELSNMRRTIAKRLTQSKTTIPHAYSTVDCRIGALLELRQSFKKDGISLSVNDAIIKAVAIALQLCPDVNVVWKGEEVERQGTADIAVAVATDSGLITPIVRDAGGCGLQEISNAVRDLANRARLGKLQLHEFQGGSFTISNLGMFGVSEFSAIINPPQCAILAVGGSRLVLGEEGEPVTVMSATLSYDERAISPDSAAHFMVTLQGLLQSPQSLLLGRPIAAVDVQ